MSARDRAAKAVERAAAEVAHRVGRSDGWQNSVRGFGTGADAATASRFLRKSRTEWTQLRALYYGDDILQRIADTPSREMMRRGFDVVVDKVDGLQDASDVSRKIMAEHETLSTRAKIREALTWSAVYGGACILPGFDDRADGEVSRDLSQPLREDAIRSVRWLNVLTAYDIRVVEWQSDAGESGFGNPVMYEIWRQRYGDGALRTGTKIHASRMWRFDAQLVDYDEAYEWNGWGPSVYETILDVVRDFVSTYQALGSVVQNAAQAVMKLGALADTLMESDGEEVVRTRIRLMDMTRSVLKAVILDASENEDFTYQQATMAGYADAIDRMMARVSAAAKQPQSLLFGQAPAGLNATGSADVRFFYDYIDGRRNDEVAPFIEWITGHMLSARLGPTGGVVPGDWKVSFPSLWQPTDDEQADIYQKNASADQVYMMTGGVDPRDIFDARWKGGAYQNALVIDEKKGRDTRPTTIEADPDVPLTASSTTAGEPADVQRAALNGAQVASVIETVSRVARRELPRSSGVEILLAGFPLSREEAERIIGESGKSFTIEKRDEDDADSFVPTDEMATAAERGLALREEFGRGGTEVGIARARDIMNKRSLSVDTVRRMRAFFDRHERNKDTPPEEGNGQIAWMLWGGDPGDAWSKRILERLDRGL
jgi:phage-related protein (TIGR01555 family)